MSFRFWAHALLTILIFGIFSVTTAFAEVDINRVDVGDGYFLYSDGVFIPITVLRVESPEIKVRLPNGISEWVGADSLFDNSGRTEFESNLRAERELLSNIIVGRWSWMLPANPLLKGSYEFHKDGTVLSVVESVFGKIECPSSTYQVDNIKKIIFVDYKECALSDADARLRVVSRRGQSSISFIDGNYDDVEFSRK